MVTDPQAVCKLMQGGNGFLSSPTSGVTWIQMSTLDMESVLDCSKKAAAKGWRFVDCPVSGSKKQVEAAELILLAGADQKDLQGMRPLLSRLGKKTVHAGPVGAGTALKLCMNLIVAQMTTGLAEASISLKSGFNAIIGRSPATMRPNSRMSAPATNVDPAPTTTMDKTESSA